MELLLLLLQKLAIILALAVVWSMLVRWRQRRTDVLGALRKLARMVLLGLLWVPAALFEWWLDAMRSTRGAAGWLAFPVLLAILLGGPALYDTLKAPPYRPPFWGSLPQCMDFPGRYKLRSERFAEHPKGTAYADVLFLVERSCYEQDHDLAIEVLHFRSPEDAITYAQEMKDVLLKDTHYKGTRGSDCYYPVTDQAIFSVSKWLEEQEQAKAAKTVRLACSSLDYWPSNPGARPSIYFVTFEAIGRDFLFVESSDRAAKILPPSVYVPEAIVLGDNRQEIAGQAFEGLRTAWESVRLTAHP